MTTITRERLLEIIEDGFLKHGESKELARIALASLEAEKVTLYRERNPYNGMTTGWQELTEQEYEFVKDNASENAEFSTVYTAPLAPVVPEGWISCSDAVPADFCDVILHDALGNVFPGSWDKVYCSIRGGNKTAFVDNDGIEVENATHWMPLPEPPASAGMDRMVKAAFDKGMERYGDAMVKLAEKELAIPSDLVGELTMLVKRLAWQLKKAKPDCGLPDKAMGYLGRNGLIGAEDALR